MGYLSIPNLYRSQDVLMFKEVFCLEKIDGTSSYVSYKDDKIKFYAGGAKHDTFVALFNHDELLAKFRELGSSEVTVYGEAYGGKMQGMSHTYGKDLKFVAFEVKIGEHCFLSVPDAEGIVLSLNLQFVHYWKSTTELEQLNKYRDHESIQAIRNGIGPGKIMEGIIIRPLIELRKNNGSRIMAKHKRDEFRETAKPREVADPAKLAVLSNAKEVAEEWVVPQRLNHVLQKIPNHSIECMRDIIQAVVDDVYREGKGEIVESREVSGAIGKRTAYLYKELLKNQLVENNV